MKNMLASAALLSVLVAAQSLTAQESRPHWIGTWAAAPVAMRVNPGQIAPGDSTYRDIVHISEGGDSVRVELTNEFGTQPLSIGAAHIARSVAPGKDVIEPGSDHALTFSGQPSVTIPAGAFVYSDPVPLAVPAMANLAVSVYLPEQALGNETRDALNAKAEAGRKKLEGELNAKLAEAEKTIVGTKAAAMSNVQGIAVETASAIVQQLIGTAPAGSEVQAAVAAVLKR